MYEKFTVRARKVMQLANQEAQRFNHEYIGTEHILLGLIKDGSGVGAKVLKNLDIDLRKIRLEVEKLVQSGPEMVTMGKLPQTPRAKRVVKYSMEEARHLHHDYVGTEHLLLGLLREREGVAAQVLRNLGLTVENVRAEALNLGQLALHDPLFTSRTDALATSESLPGHERFTDRARKVMQLADREAKRFNHEYIGTEHILLGLIQEGSGVAANVLKNLDVDLGRVRQTVFKLIQPGPEGEVVIGKLPQTPRAKKVIEYAMEESRRLEHNYVGSEHILLGLLREEEGVAAQVLMNLGLKLDTVRAEVLSLLGHPSNDSGSYIPQSTAEVALKPVETVREFLYHPRRSDSVGTTCPKCGAQLVRILWNRTHLNPEELQEVSAQRAILAHKPGRNTPFWVCSTCEPRWSEVHRLALQDYQWQRAKEEAVLQEQYETAIQLRDQQRELRPRLMALVEELLGGA